MMIVRAPFEVSMRESIVRLAEQSVRFTQHPASPEILIQDCELSLFGGRLGLEKLVMEAQMTVDEENASTPLTRPERC